MLNCLNITATEVSLNITATETLEEMEEEAAGSDSEDGSSSSHSGNENSSDEEDSSDHEDSELSDSNRNLVRVYSVLCTVETSKPVREKLQTSSPSSSRDSHPAQLRKSMVALY